MESAIKIDHLTKVFADRKVLDEISFEVKVGQIHGFLGPNGAGKSTTMKILSGIISPTAGEVKVLGQELEQNLDFVKKQIGILPENPALYMDMKVEDYLKFALDLRAIKDPANIEYALEKTGIKDIRKRLIGNLSKGYKQRVAVAQAIVSKPKIIILDEPTVGLDPASILEMRSLIRSLANEHTVIYSSHQLHEVSLTCTHITIINQGKIVTSGSLSEVEKKFEGKKKVRFELAQIPDGLVAEIKKLDFVQTASVDGKYLSVQMDSKLEKRPELLQFLLGRQLSVLEMVSEKQDLEEIFLELTKGVSK